MTGLAQIPHSCSPTSTNIREATQARGLQGEYNAFVHKTMKRGSEDLKSSPIPPANSKVRVYIYTWRNAISQFSEFKAL